jgi:hypothetical protein
VEWLERLVVHVEEAIRLGMAADVAHQRLGLILLDSAAELLMHRQCEALLSRSSLYDGLIKSLEQVSDQRRDEKYGEIVDDIARHTLSRTRRNKIDKEFDAKCDFLREKSLLADPQVRVLKKLHAYRNETYHRDEVRSGSLASATKIYVYIVCTMMRDLPQTAGLQPIRFYLSRDITPILARYIDTSIDGPLDFNLQSSIAKQLMEASNVGEPQQLGLALAQHVKDRLDDLEESAAETIDWFQHVNMGYRSFSKNGSSQRRAFMASPYGRRSTGAQGGGRSKASGRLASTR